jgi:hypothetical protein
MVNAGEHVEERTRRRRREPHAVGGYRRHAESRGHRHEGGIGGLLVAPIVTLQLDEHVVAPEHSHHTIEQAADTVPPAVERRAPDDRHEPARGPVQFVDRQRALAFRRA